MTNSYNASQVINLPVDGGPVVATINATACIDNKWYFRVFSDLVNGFGQANYNRGRWAGYSLDATSNDTLFTHFGCGGYHGARVTPSGSIGGFSWDGPLQDIPWNGGQTYMDQAGVYWINFKPSSIQVGQTFNATITAQVGVTSQELCQDIRESREVTWTVKFLVVAGSCPDITPPTVTSSSVSGTSGFITLSATATDNIGVSKVEFYIDGVLKGTDPTAPYSLSFDSGTIPNGLHTLIVKAWDAAGNFGGSAGITFTTNNVIQPPSITVQPVPPLSINEGSTTWFSVTAVGTAPLSYQWLRNDIAIPGAISSTYTTPAVTMADNGAGFKVTISNPAGSVTSDIIVLHVVPTTHIVTAAIAIPSSDITVNSGASVNFLGTGTSIDSIPRLNFNWNFGDGSQVVNSMFGDASHAFTSNSTVTLTVTDQWGAHASATRNITVNTSAPIGPAPIATAGNFMVRLGNRDRGTLPIYESGVSFEIPLGWTVTNWVICSEDGTPRTDFSQLRDLRLGQYLPIFVMYDGIPGNITRVFGKVTYSNGLVGTSNVVSVVSYWGN